MLVALLICAEKHEFLLCFNAKIGIMGRKYELWLKLGGLTIYFPKQDASLAEVYLTDTPFAQIP